MMPFFLSALIATSPNLSSNLEVQPRANLVASVPMSATEAEPNSKTWDLIRKKIKHVFVLYQENRSFDFYFGTFPGADGLYSQPASQTPGFTQHFIGVDGEARTVQPFRIGPDQYAADLGDADHSHESLITKMHIVDGKPTMDRYAMAEEERSLQKSAHPTLKAVQKGMLTMAHVDGDTVPILWRWAQRFTLCDHIFQVLTGPSTPGNLSVFAAQTGITQWILHPDQASYVSGKERPGVPVYSDYNPFWGSSEDSNSTGKMPYNPDDNPKRTPQINLTFPAIAITMSGGKMGEIAKEDRDPEGDLGDIKDDVAFLTKKGAAAVDWGWFEEGFDREPTDHAKSDDPVVASGENSAEGTHASYVTHHNGPQYFGFVANNPKMSSHIHGLDDFYQVIAHQTLPDAGMYYVKGGYENIMKLVPTCPDPKVQRSFVGDDDHPGYSDSQISECMLANLVNTIAKSKYWKDSVIIISWDDSDGLYDHVPPPLSTFGPDGKPVSDGPRVPMLILSPYVKTGYIFHGVGDQASIIKFADHVFNRTPLAELPDEIKARKLGAQRGIKDAGPRDGLTANVTDLSGAFDLLRLEGKRKPLAASYVMIPDALVWHLPQTIPYGLKQLGIVPIDVSKHIANKIPADFNPRP